MTASGGPRAAGDEGADGLLGDARLARGVDHLQVAATELIAAARAFLDVMEDTVADKDNIVAAVDVVAGFVRGARRLAAEDRDPGEGSGFERIDIG